MKATLKINGEKDFIIEEELTTIGRASDNKIALSDDSNVSRYHAEIENRQGEFRLVELGSSNGTTVNDKPLETEILLRDGDLIVLGGTSEIEFFLEEEKPSEEAGKSAAAAPSISANLPGANVNAPSSAPAAPDAEKAAKMPVMLIVMGLACGLAVVFAVGAALYSYSGSASAAQCDAKAVITSPETGDTINKETEITVEAENTDCVRRAVFLLDGAEIASADTAPYAATLDPKQFPALSDGGNHSLKVLLEDEAGNLFAPSEVFLAFETAEIATPTPAPSEEETPAPTATPPAGKQPSLIDVQEMSRRLVKQFSGSFAYKFDPQFLQEVQKKTAEYAAAEGYFARAEGFRDLINLEFHRGNGLDAPLGFLLAMSRSKFNPEKQGAEEGLWRLSDEFVTANGYKTICQPESLSDAAQNCAAKTSSIYAKALVLKIFNGETIYAVAAFGMTEQEASQWASQLPPNREDFWKVITSAKQREQVARFFAAGIVAENPQRFGMKKDKPISELYRNLIGN
ncbi:MAG TPA: FHA domain-containing protein [Pyrinomonadaceae bacterium]|nr:FHA domain-containing protein [Pyrinomonadaceae bacterium]